MSTNLKEKLENFSRLPDEECALIIRDYLLEAIESDIYFDWEVVSKFLTIPYEIRDHLCNLFNSAIKKNNQKISNFTVNEWIRKYQDQYLNKERNPNTFFEYVSNNPEAKKLSKRDQIKLARVLRMYDYLFIVPIFDLEGPVFNILRFPMELTPTVDRTTNPINSAEKTVPQKEIIINNIFFSEALKKYQELGEQVITSYYIKIKSFPEPVRPSIKNWIADYTSYYGYANHNQMIRGEYLFKNENAKILSAQEKEKLSYVLKAFDENDIVKVDVSSKQIVFPTVNNNTEISNSPNKIPNNKFQIPNKSQISNYQNQKQPLNSVKVNPDVGSMSSDLNRKSSENTFSSRATQINSAEGNHPNTQQKNPLAFSDDNYFANFSPSYNSGISEQRTVNNEEKRSLEADHRLIPHSHRNPAPEAARIDFSSPQKLPYEKKIENDLAPKEPPKAAPQPFRISPSKKFPAELQQEKEERPLPKNVVNLKEQ